MHLPGASVQLPAWSHVLDSPLGALGASFDPRGRLRGLGFLDGEPALAKDRNPAGEAAFRFLRTQLDAYFKGNLRTFNVPLAPEGTDFQMRVWKALLDVPYGRTLSYLDLSRQLGDEKAIRAVGRANGANPIAILVPCHRIIGSDGTLVGYGGGMERKRFLLELEGVIHREERAPALFEGF